MPLYEYECDACGQRFEVIQKSFSSPPPEECETCGKGPVHRLQSSPAIQFKGSGFYITDYAKKGTPEGGSGGSKGKSDGGKTDGSSESKSDSTSETKTDSATPKDSSAKSDAPAASTSASSTPTTSTKKD